MLNEQELRYHDKCPRPHHKKLKISSVNAAHKVQMDEQLAFHDGIVDHMALLNEDEPEAFHLENGLGKKRNKSSLEPID